MRRVWLRIEEIIEVWVSSRSRGQSLPREDVADRWKGALKIKDVGVNDCNVWGNW